MSEFVELSSGFQEGRLFAGQEMLDVCVFRWQLTIDYNRGGGAAPLGYDVLRHTGVVGRIREAGLFDDQIMVDGDVEVPVVGGINNLLVLQPLHLRRR